MFVNKILLFLTFVHFSTYMTNSSKILAIVSTPSYSHQVALWPIWKALSARGHNITLITSDPDDSIKGIRQINISHTYDIIKKFDLTKKTQENNNNFFEIFDLFVQLNIEVENAVLGNPEVQKLIHGNDQFDLVMAEIWHTSMLGFSHRFTTPLIGVSSIEAHYLFHDVFGNPTNPVIYPEMMVPFYGPLSFLERLFSTLTSAVMRYMGSRIYDIEEPILKKYFGSDCPGVDELIKRMDMLFMNTDNIFYNIRPLVPAVVKIGGGLHIKEPEPLPDDIQEYLDAGTEGVIYFSLGSNVKSKDLTPNLTKVIMETFSELPYKVLWKFEADELPGKPENVKIAKWLPQQDILGHPNVKLFITQGGSQSIDEAIYNHVPMIGLPFFGDQPSNINKIVFKGIAIGFDHSTLEKETFKSGILEVLKNEKYRNKIKELSKLVMDEPMSGIEKAVWWTEYVLRHKGAKHLKSGAADLPTSQFYLLDVLGALSIILLIVLYIVYKIGKLLYSLGKSLFRISKIKTN